MNTTPAKTGHNNAPSDLEILGERIALTHVTLLKEAEGYLEFVEKIPGEFKEEIEAEFTTDFIRKIQSCQKILEKEHTIEKAPFLSQGRYVDSVFLDLVKKLDKVIERAKAPLNDYMQKKANTERLAREAEAAAMRKEATEAAQAVSQQANPADTAQALDMAITLHQVANVAERVADVPVAALAVTKGKFGSAGLNEKYVGTITNAEILDLNKLRPYIKLKELEAAVDKFVKNGGRQLDGAEIKKTIETKVK